MSFFEEIGGLEEVAVESSAEEDKQCCGEKGEAEDVGEVPVQSGDLIDACAEKGIGTIE